MNELHSLKASACERVNPVDKINKVSIIEDAIIRTNNDLDILRRKQTDETTFRAKARWYEYGEKSNEYPLGWFW